MSRNSTRRTVSVALLLAPFLAITTVAWIGRARVASTLSPLVADAGTQNKNAPPKKERARLDCSKVDDATVVASVKAALASTPSLKGLEIEVEAKDRAVTLTGKEMTRNQRKTAGRVARGVECVRRVYNRIQCGQGQKPCGDDCIPRNAPCGKHKK